MKSFFMNLLLKCLSIDTVSSLIASCIARLLEYARGKSDEKWDTAKSVVNKINIWTNLFIEVYDDDKLTEAEEIKIAEAIKNSTTVEKIYQIINTDKTETV